MTLLVDVMREVERVAALLDRPIRLCGPWVVERCPVCEIEYDVVAPSTPTIDARRLHRMLFRVYREHECQRIVSGAYASEDTLDELYARTEAASVRLAERAILLEPPDANLRKLAERESERLAAWAATLSVLRQAPVSRRHR